MFLRLSRAILLVFMMSVIPSISSAQNGNLPVLNSNEAANATKVDDIVVSGKTIKIGMTHDAVIAIIPTSAAVSQKVSTESSQGGGLYVLRKYSLDGKEFILGFKRLGDPGPFKLHAIYVVK